MPDSKSPTSSQGNLLGLLTAAFYVLFTLLPDSNSLMVQWPWVFLWQVGLICPVLWLLGLVWQGRFHWLGNQLDWGIGLLVAGLIVSAGLAPFPMQARWYSFATLCFVAALYALSSWLETPARRLHLLTAQGYLNLAFIALSLILWISQTLSPELARLQEFQGYGVSLPFDFSTVELRNWAPIGHQNYVAGYLVVALPLLIGLGIQKTGWRRWIWFVGAGLGCVDLYTTSSRGGWIGLLVITIVGFAVLLCRSTLPRLWVSIAGATGLIALIGLALSNNRLYSLITGAFSGQAGGETAYRIITITTGWRMGLSRLLGQGPGSVPLMYQQYRPTWAGGEAELAYQLHSTPAHVWAELGVASIAVALGAIFLVLRLLIRWLRATDMAQSSALLIGCLFCSLLAYGVFSLTDYQLDNVCISGTLVIFLAVLAAELREPDTEARSQLQATPLQKFPLFLPLAGLGMLLAAAIWLIPIHRAWMLSSQGFAALSREDVNTFAQQLQQSHQLAPEEPYYSYQLGWNLGDLSLKTTDRSLQQTLATDSISWFQKGIQAAPSQEFGHTNLAWLLLERDPKTASQEFARSAQLIPAKRGVFYGLGLSLVAQGKLDLAIKALALEALRYPSLIASPLWQQPQFQPLYKQLVPQVESGYTTLLQQTQNSEPLATQLHQSRGGLRWWQGDLAGAHTDWDRFGLPIARQILNLTETKGTQATPGNPSPSAGTLAIEAWLNPAKRQELLQQAWIRATHTVPPPQILQQLVETMARSTTLEQWLKQNAPSRSYRRERAGFGVLSRHIDGPTPTDFLTVVDNIPMAQFFDQLLPVFRYAPELDSALQPQRDTLLQQVLAP